MRVLDTDCDGKVSLAEMRDAVIAIYRERKNLAFTLKVLGSCNQLVITSSRRPTPSSMCHSC